MEESAIDQLLSILLTKKDVLLMCAQLDAISQAIFAKDGELETILSKNLSREKKDILQRLIADRGVNMSNIPSFQEFISSLRATIASLPVIEFEVAIEPSNSLVVMVTDWVERNIPQKTIVDFKVNKDLIGGAVISYNGRVKQYSIAHALQSQQQT